MFPRLSINIITLSALALMASAAPQTPGTSVGERAYVVFEGSPTCAVKSCTKTADCGSKCGACTAALAWTRMARANGRYVLLILPEFILDGATPAKPASANRVLRHNELVRVLQLTIVLDTASGSIKIGSKAAEDGRRK
ncbi:hypothetical protein B0H14DRAFT_2601120 [Mycena olivaceomarginata]|nr:hypothetical protein B0H14DRAFT_2601120 [Mycena olivaceomarginata]